LVSKRDEPHAVISRDLLESAAGRPRTYLAYNETASIVELGVVLIEAIGKNHCFVQGNKRTAFHAGIAFMRVNGVQVTVPDTEERAAFFQRLIEGTVSPEEATRLCGSCVVAPV
jgi:death on curing protein